jgi:hypothetical protein
MFFPRSLITGLLGVIPALTHRMGTLSNPNALAESPNKHCLGCSRSWNMYCVPFILGSSDSVIVGLFEASVRFPRGGVLRARDALQES